MRVQFRDRQEAALKLAAALKEYRGKNPLVLAIPRGAVPMAKIIARELSGDLDVVLVRKLGAPGNPEFAIGAVDESGWCYVADHAKRAGADEAYIEEEKEAQLQVIRSRRAKYTGSRPPVNPQGRVVIVVDDGLATGATMITALHAIRDKKPQKLICAVPVASIEAAENVATKVDQLVCLETPEEFYAVGQFYDSFPQVNDDEVVSALVSTTNA